MKLCYLSTTGEIWWTNWYTVVDTKFILKYIAKSFYSQKLY